MMRTSIVIASLLLASFVHAQKFKDSLFFLPRGCFDIQYGFSFPILDYGLDELTQASGYANLGQGYRISFQYDIAPVIGFSLHYFYNSNPFNGDKYLTDLQSQQGNTLIFHKFKSDPWILQGIMLGVYYPFRSYRTTIDIRLSGGVLNGTYPQNELDFTIVPFNNLRINAKEFATRSSDFAFQVGIKLRHRLYKKLLFTASSDFTYTDIEFGNRRAVDTNTNLPLLTEPYTQYFHIIQLLAGIGIAFE
jgi:hypothetical protein